jgi:type IV pilus assembly protein PilB
MSRKLLGESLVEAGFISARQLAYALSLQKKNFHIQKLGQVLMSLSCINEDTLVEFLGRQYDTPGINLYKEKIDETAVYTISGDIAEKYRVIPVGFKLVGRTKKLIVAMSDPSNIEVTDTIAFLTGYIIEPIFAKEEDLKWTIRHYYSKIKIL